MMPFVPETREDLEIRCESIIDMQAVGLYTRLRNRLQQGRYRSVRRS